MSASCPSPPPLAVVVASTGGPEALRQVLAALDPSVDLPFLVHLPGPAWMLRGLAERLAQETGRPAALAGGGEEPRPGGILLTPPSSVLVLEDEGLVVRPLTGPRGADLLLSSVARRRREAALALVLSGMGWDGARGCASLAAAGGAVLVQEPGTAVAPTLPRSVLRATPRAEALPPARLPEALARWHEAVRSPLPHEVTA